MAYPNPKGYITPPQDMPPKTGFFFPKFRMSTLQPKGLTTFQIVFSFVGMWAFGFLAYRDHSEVRSGRVLTQTSQLLCQRQIFKILYGPAEKLSEQSDPRSDAWFGIDSSHFRGRDKRVEAFVSIVMADEKRMKAYNFRDATRDPLVAPYQICYGPETYALPHTCDSYCISVDEIRQVREQDAKAKNVQAQSV